MPRIPKALLALVICTATLALGGVQASADVSFVSDDFDASVLGSAWSVVDPLGDGSVSLVGAGSGDAHLELSVPAGVSHDAWQVNRSLRVMQPVADGDVELEAWFDSVPSSRYQMQGLLFEQDADDWVRFDVFSTGSQLRGFAAVTSGGSSSAQFSVKLDASVSAIGVRVARVGDLWEMLVSSDGVAWSSLGSFSAGLSLSSAGVFAANHTPSPAFTARVDYVFDTSSPVVPEDGQSGGGGDGFSVTTGVVGAGSVVRDPDLSEYPSGSSVELTAVPAAGWAFDGWEGDASGSVNPLTVTVGADLAITARFVATGGGGSGPTIDVWDGLTQTFGAVGVPQPWANIRGNVSSPAGMASLSYQVNGGVAQPLSIGPDNRRLDEPGDFNIELDRGALPAGTSTVTITATDTSGDSSSVVVTVDLAESSAPLPMTVDWSAQSAIAETAEIVDGRWQLDGAEVRLVDFTALGYDRLIAIGDGSWTDFEATVPIRLVNGFGDGWGTGQSGTPLVGVGMRWQGHTQTASSQPRFGYYPAGSYTWFRWADDLVGGRFELVGNYGAPNDRFKLWTPAIGDTFMVKVRAETVTGGTQYSAKYWLAGDPEPSGWSTQLIEDDGPAAGSLLLIAHHVDARFGTVQVQPLGAAAQPPTASGTVDVTSGAAPLAIQVDGTSSTSPGGSIVSYAWDFGDGSTATTATAGHTYVSAGSYPVTLTVTDSNGASVTSTIGTVDVTGGPGTSGWADAERAHRVRITVPAGAVGRVDRPAEVDVDFAQILSTLGATGTFDPVSLHLVEVDAGGVVLASGVPVQFDPASAGSSSGTLLVQIDGSLPAGQTRLFDLYFDVVGSGFTPVTFTPLVTVDPSSSDEGLATLGIDTPTGGYEFDLAGGGFSSLTDTDGNDWVGYSSAAGSAGQFRGIPNLIHPEGQFHPGGSGVLTTLVESGPLRATFDVSAGAGAWSGRWSVYPTFARFELSAAGHDYWFLYEGAPGGLLDTSSDVYVRSDGSSVPASANVDTDIADPEWAMVGDLGVGRSLFFAHDSDDGEVDAFRTFGSEMAMLSFGRTGSTPLQSAAPDAFTFGFVDATTAAGAAATVDSARLPLGGAVGVAESQS